MEQQRPGKKPGRAWLMALAVILPVILLAAAVYLLLFGYNHFSLELTLRDGEQVTLEYGEHYREPGCRVLLRGSKFWKSGLELNTTAQISGRVNEQKLGQYVLDYRVDFLGLEANAARIVRVVDTVCPVITLVPDGEDLQSAPEYQEAGFSAYDNYDGDITAQVAVVHREQEGKITYCVMDSSGNPAYAEREIPIYDQYPPELTLLGGERVVLPLGEKFADPGYTAFDRMDGDLTAQVTVTIDHPFIRYQPDSYQLTYQVTDSQGRQTVASRTLVTEPSPRPLILYPKGKTIYLTFDDGPCPDTARLLDILKRYNVKATFFVVDTGYPDLMRRMVNEGHSIGIHTRSHRYGEIYSGADAYFEDVFAMQQLIQDATGVETWLLRFPGGSSNTISRKNQGIMTYLTQAVEDCGFSYFDWNVDSDDAGNAKTAGAVFQNVVDGVRENSYSVVLQHDIHSCSVDAVERIILWGQSNGYQFLPLQTDSPVVHHVVQN
ncbi:MAG: immunoglobulin-like domain-containing protein [Faecousia sp.]